MSTFTNSSDTNISTSMSTSRPAIDPGSTSEARARLRGLDYATIGGIVCRQNLTTGAFCCESCGVELGTELEDLRKHACARSLTSDLIQGLCPECREYHGWVNLAARFELPGCCRHCDGNLRCFAELEKGEIPSHALLTEAAQCCCNIEPSELSKLLSAHMDSASSCTCDNCGATIAVHRPCDHFGVGGAIVHLCDSCRREAGLAPAYFACDSCTETQLWTERTVVQGEELCTTCFDRQVERNEIVQCADCNIYFYVDSCTYLAEQERYVCDSCYNHNSYRLTEEERNILSLVGGYHDRPELHFFGSGSAFYGAEIELEHEEKYSLVQTLGMFRQECGDRVWYNADGSLSCDGVEVITHPHTIRAWEEELYPMLKQAMSYSAHSEDSSCGLHVHVSRTAFSSVEKEEIFCGVWHTIAYSTELAPVVRRTSNHYCKVLPYLHGENFLTYCHLVADKGETRYLCANNTNAHTIELRSFAGATTAEHVLAAVELTSCLVDFVNETSVEYLHQWFHQGTLAENFVAYVGTVSLVGKLLRPREAA